MVFNRDGEPMGYVYPRPSIEGVTIRPEPSTSPKTLSQDDREKIQRAVKKIEKGESSKAC